MRCIGPYAIEGELGRGGFGVVARARRADGAPVAIKVLLRRGSGAALARFARERQLQHELALAGGFVPVLDAGECELGPYMVMPLLTGGTLRDRLRHGPWDADDVLVLARTLADALGRAHARGVVHRDLKPDNVLYDAAGTPLVADLGLGKELDATTPELLTRTGSMAGTSGYAAPEQMIDAKRVTPAADVFSLGAILYECLTGQAAFAGPTMVDVLTRIQRGGLVPVAELRPDAPPALARLIERCLSSDPTQRYPDGAAVASALSGVGESPEAPRPRASWGALAGVVVSVGLLAGLLLVGGALAIRGRTESPPPAPAPAPAPTPALAIDPDPTPAPVVEPPPPAPPVEPPPVEVPIEPPPPPMGSRASLSEALSGLAGLTVEGQVGSGVRRFEAPLRFLAASPAGLIGCDASGTVRGFDRVTLSEAYARQLVRGEPTAFAASPDGTAMAVATRGEVVVYGPGGEPATSQLVLDPNLVVSALVVTSQPTLVVWAEGPQIRVYHRAERKAVVELRGHTADVTALALGDGRLFSADASGALVSFRMGPRKQDWSVEATWNCGRALTCAAVSPDGAWVAGASADGTWAWWDPRTGRAGGQLALPEHGAPLAARFLEREGVLLAATSSRLLRIRTADASLASQHPLERPAALAALDGGGTREVFAEAGGSVMWALDLAAGRPLPPPHGHLAPLTDGAPFAGGVLTIDARGRALGWAQDGRLVTTVAGADPTLDAIGLRPSVATTADGHALVADGTRALLISPTGSRTLDEAVTCVAGASGGQFVAGTAAGHVVWIDTGGQVVRRDPSLAGGRVLRVLPTAEGVLGLAEKGGQTWLWNGRPGGPRPQRLIGAEPGALAVVAGGRAAVGTRDGSIKVQTPHMGGRMVYENQAHEGPVLALAGSPDGRELLSAGADATLAVWRVQESGQLELLERRSLIGLGDRVCSLTPLGEGRLLVGTARGLGLLCRWGDPPRSR